MNQPLQSSEPVIKREMISSDKDGTLEKVYFAPRAVVEKQPDGTEKTAIREPWEVRATGRKVNELRGAFKDVAPSMLHESKKEWDARGGDLTITKPDGSTDVVCADQEAQYKEIPGFCRSRVRPGISVPHMPWHKPCGHSKHQHCNCEEN